jgi:hypothetical protein
MEYRMMLNLRRNNMLALGLMGFRDTPDCHVVGFGSATQKDNFGGFRVDQARDLLAGLIDKRFRVLAKPVDGRGIAEVFIECGKHQGGDFGPHGGCGIAVQINTFHTSCGVLRHAIFTPPWNLVETHDPNQ